LDRPHKEQISGITRDEAIAMGLETIFRDSDGFLRHAPARWPFQGTFVAYARPSETARLCREMAEHLPDDSGLPTPHRNGSEIAGNFRCGHPRVPENTYGTGSTARCRRCAIDAVAAHRRKNRERYSAYGVAYRARHKKKARDYRIKHQLALQLYFQIRDLAIRDGLWPTKRKPTTKERSVA